MSPSEGTVAVSGSQAVTCSVRPTDASVFVSQAALRVGHGVNAIKPKPLLDMKVSGHLHVLNNEKCSGSGAGRSEGKGVSNYLWYENTRA